MIIQYTDHADNQLSITELLIICEISVLLHSIDQPSTWVLRCSDHEYPLPPVSITQYWPDIEISITIYWRRISPPGQYYTVLNRQLVEYYNTLTPNILAQYYRVLAKQRYEYYEYTDLEYSLPLGQYYPNIPRQYYKVLTKQRDEYYKILTSNIPPPQYYIDTWWTILLSYTVYTLTHNAAIFHLTIQWVSDQCCQRNKIPPCSWNNTRPAFLPPILIVCILNDP